MKHKLIRPKKHPIRDYLRGHTSWFLDFEIWYRRTKIKYGRKFGLIPPYIPPIIDPVVNDRFGGMTIEEFEAGFGNVPDSYDIDKMPQADIID